MSNTANWSYTNTATVKPFLGMSEWGGASYGPEYTIACTWTAVSQQQRDDNGAEFVSRFEIFTEDARPKMLETRESISDGFNSNWRNRHQF